MERPNCSSIFFFSASRDPLGQVGDYIVSALRQVVRKRNPIEREAVEIRDQHREGLPDDDDFSRVRVRADAGRCGTRKFVTRRHDLNLRGKRVEQLGVEWLLLPRFDRGLGDCGRAQGEDENERLDALHSRSKESMTSGVKRLPTLPLSRQRDIRRICGWGPTSGRVAL